MTDEQWGPLAALAGTWRGDEGLDVAWSHAHGASWESPYTEELTLTPFGPVVNGSQHLYGLDHRSSMWRGGEQVPFHTEVGYWLWDSATNEVVRGFVVPRGITVLAGGVAEPVVDPLEVVEVAEQQGVRGALRDPARLAVELAEPLLERAAVEEAGQGVGDGLLVQDDLVQTQCSHDRQVRQGRSNFLAIHTPGRENGQKPALAGQGKSEVVILQHSAAMGTGRCGPQILGDACREGEAVGRKGQDALQGCFEQGLVLNDVLATQVRSLVGNCRVHGGSRVFFRRLCLMLEPLSRKEN